MVIYVFISLLADREPVVLDNGYIRWDPHLFIPLTAIDRERATCHLSSLVFYLAFCCSH